MEVAAQPQDTRRRRSSAWYALAALALLCAQGGIHLAYLARDCPLDLSGDEAHYWEWSRQLDLSYYSKGPLVAYIIAASRAVLATWSEQLVGSEALAVRVPAILLSIVTGFGIYVLARQTVGSAKLALAAVAITFTIPVLAAGSFLMTIDAPLACCYVWALICAARGLRGPQLWPWLVAGVLIAVGVLAKYTMVLVFPAIGLAMLVAPGYRAALRRPGPYLAVVLGLLAFVPIVLWNAQHDWVSLRHVAGQAGVSGRHALDPLGPLTLLAGQAAVIGPVWFIALVWAVVALLRGSKRSDDGPQTSDVNFLVAATITPWLVFLVFSPLTKIQPNWPVLAVVPGVIVLVVWLARLLENPQRRRAAQATIAAGVLLGGTSVVVLHHSEWLMPLFTWLARSEPPWNLTPTAKYDPSSRLRGWGQLGAAVGRVSAAERAAGHAPFIITDDYQVASEIAFYCPGEPTVYCLQAALGARQSQYDIWRPNPLRDPDSFGGRPCIYVGTLKPELTGRVESGHAALVGVRLAETVEHRVREQAVAIWPVYVCDEFRGLPPELMRGSGKY
jgi:4-amino-4-deoxy-L-arabinose transferase-like glycosyltransferase